MPKSQSFEVIRSQLMSELHKKRVNLSKVAALSARLFETDPTQLRFSVDAAHLRRLGAELIGRVETALAELVKNAYDADATEVLVRFERADVAGGCLRIEDDGEGMSRRDLVDGFMRLSTPNKIDKPISPRFGRARAGRKGIGRFAVQRLGTSLKLTTQTRTAKTAWQIEISWDQFASGKELAEIAASISSVSKERSHGTVLEIGGLESAWPELAITETARQLREIVLDRDTLSKLHGGREPDPGMRIFVQRDSGPQVDVEALVETDLSRLALARVDATVGKTGSVRWSLSSDRLGINEREKTLLDRDGKEILAPLLKGVRLSAFYFIYERGLLPPRELGKLRDLGKRVGGIRLYRNGFRVLPYGETGDDWLGLDTLSRQRVVLPAVANNNWFGKITIDDPAGERFEETTSREGLVQNQAFRAISSTFRALLETVALRVASARGRKQFASDETDRVAPRALLDATTTLQKELESVVESVRRDSPAIADKFSSVLALAAQTTNAAAGDIAASQRLLDELSMLRILASVGITVGEFTHEIRMHLPSLENAVLLLSRAKTASDLQKAAELVGPALKPLRTLLGYFERTFSDQAKRETQVLELRDMINDFEATVKPDASRRNIEMGVDALSSGLFTVPMHESEWITILFNLYSNAKKAIQRRGEARGILVRVGRSGRELFLEFADTGDGIPPENVSRIFSPFFTTTAKLEDADEDPSGLGLGLSIVRDIVEGYGGRIGVVEPPPGYRTAIRLWVPAARPSEVPDHAY